MAKLYITEYADITNAKGGYVQCGEEPAVTEQVVNITGVSAQSAAFNAKTRYVRLHTDIICSIKFGSSPTATTSSARMAENQTEFFGVTGLLPDSLLKVAVITNT